MDFDYDLLGKFKFWLSLSIVLVLGGGLLIFLGGLNMGIDFAGGTEFTVELEDSIPTGEIRSKLTDVDTALSNSKIQEVRGENWKTITTKLNVSENQDTIEDIEKTLYQSFSIPEGGISRKSVGTQISRELQNKGWQAVILALVVILIYLSWRFRLRYAIGAVLAVVHDVTIALALFSLFQVEINLPTIGAFLTIVGYSLNDTIVYFDRIRENTSKRSARALTTFELINKSINQSLPRTLGTSATTFVPVLALVLFGGPVLKAFSLALLIGVLVGTYSSIYIAAPVVYLWDKYLAKE
ncbi:MAG: protein translocase subunit SecF [Candidatus Acetothermia bacterium]